MIRKVYGYFYAILIGILFTQTSFGQSPNMVNCYPASAGYWTGTTTANSKTDSALIHSLGGYSRGWMKFDVSNIPDGATITDIKLNYYISGSYWPYYRFTKLTADPVTTAAPNLFNLIGQGNTASSPNTYFDYSGNEMTGQQQVALNNNAKLNLQASLLQNWFAMGVYEYDQTTYFLQIAGWNTIVKPYLTVQYQLPVQNDIGIQSLISPQQQITPGNYPVQILLKNFGTNYINSCLINLTINNVVQTQYSFNDTISPGNTRMVTLSTVNFQPGVNILTVTASMPNGVTDQNPSNNSLIQTIVVYVPTIYYSIDSVAACQGDNVTVPVFAWSFAGVDSLKMTINYSGSTLLYNGFTQAHPALTNFTMNSSSGNPNHLIMTANSPVPMSIPNSDTMVLLHFTYLGGAGSLVWDTTYGSCYNLGSNGYEHPLNLHNGGVESAGAHIYNQPPAVLNCTIGTNATLSVWAWSYSGLSYQWQASTNGGTSWGNLTNNNQHGGVLTQTLTIYNVQTYHQGLKYRCVVTGACGPELSTITTLSVTSLPVYCTLDSVYACSADTFAIAVQVQNFNAVTSFSLRLLVDPTKLDFAYWNNLNLALGSGSNFNINQAGDTLIITWNGSNTTGFNSGDLVYLYFLPLGSGCSYALNWVDNGNAASTFYGTSGTPLVSYLGDGWVCESLPPSAAGPITGPMNVCTGSTVVYSIAPIPHATNYVWTLPPGANIVSGWSSNSISVYFGVQATTGTITVKGYNNCGYSTPAYTPAVVSLSPGPIGYINGPLILCQGQTNITFTCPVSTNATSYNWVLPAGLTGYSNTNTIMVNVNSSYTGGVIQVAGMNSCGTGGGAVLYIQACAAPIDSLTCILPEMYACEGLIHYPVIVNNGSDIASISLGINYDSQHLAYQGYSNPNSGLSTGFLAVNTNGSAVQIGWFSVTPIDLDNDTLLMLDFIADTGYSMLSFDLQTSGACYFTDINSSQLDAWYINGYIYVGSCAEINGTLTYDNPASSPLSNTAVSLSGQFTEYTDMSGNFTFSTVSPDSYDLMANVTKPAGGINATDALKVLNHFVNTQPLTGLKLQAADVDGTGFVNASDGLMVAKRFVGLISTFPVGDWLSTIHVMNVSSSGTYTANMKAVCYGDLDGSFTPALKESPAVEISANGLGIETRNKTFSLPLSSTRDAVAGAVSLVIRVPDSKYTLMSVDGLTGGNLLWNQLGTEIRIAWYSLSPLNIKTGEPIMNLNFSFAGFDAPAVDERFIITAESGSAIANPQAEVLEQFGLVYPDRFVSENEYLMVSPNPVKNECLIEFKTEGSVNNTLRLFNSQGQQIREIPRIETTEGIQIIRLDLAELTPGVYMLILDNGTRIRYARIIKE